MMETNNKLGLGILIGFLISSILALLLFVVCDKILFKDKNQKDAITNKEELVNNDTCTKMPIPKCVGTYYGEAIGSYANGLSYNLKYMYTLKEDGTFSADFGGVSGTSGTFVINDNTISLTGIKEVAGPNDMDTHYATGDYLIADDCSYILYDSEIDFKLFKK